MTLSNPSFTFRKCQLLPDNAYSSLNYACIIHFTGESQKAIPAPCWEFEALHFQLCSMIKRWNRLIRLAKALESLWSERLNVLEQVNCQIFLFTFFDSIKQSEKKKSNRLHVSFLNLNIWVFLNWIIWLEQTTSEGKGVGRKKKSNSHFSCQLMVVASTWILWGPMRFYLIKAWFILTPACPLTHSVKFLSVLERLRGLLVQGINDQKLILKLAVRAH